MKMFKRTRAAFRPVRLIVSACVRYWEDAEVNGVSDDDGSLIPLKEGGMWKPVIELDTGRVIDWPHGTTADIHYKVCDAGEYWLEDAEGGRLKYQDSYVPRLLSVGDDGFGDYIILKITEGGIIEGWGVENLRQEDWGSEDEDSED
jgi:hypothetical protein